MKINIIVDETLKEIEVEIKTPLMTDKITKLAEKLLEGNENKLKVYTENDFQTTVNIDEVYRIYSLKGKVYINTQIHEYSSKQRLYELEEMLTDENFLRISNSEIINLNKVEGYDLSFPKTIAITMKNNQITYVSRRYVSTVKPYLMPREKAEDFPLIITNVGAFIDVIIFDEDLVESFEELGFTKYESDFPLWKQNQYSKRLEEFSVEISEKWVSYFISLGAVFANDKDGSPRDLLLTAVDKGIIKEKEVFVIKFLANEKYSINREKIVKLN